MTNRREFRRLTFGRKLEVKKLRAALVRTMRQSAKDPAAEAAPARLESILIEPKRTVVYVSGNGPGLDAVAAAVRKSLPGDVEVAKARRADARRLPSALGSKGRR